MFRPAIKRTVTDAGLRVAGSHQSHITTDRRKPTAPVELGLCHSNFLPL
jgi:hypothetical protein